jgi:hypothetical protein
MILFKSKPIRDFVRGLRRGICEFRKASKDVVGGFDQTGFDAGQSLGGIHGKTAFEALTTDNQTVELYDPPISKSNGENGSMGGSDEKKLKTKTTRVWTFIWIGLSLILFFTLAKWLFTARG